MSVAGVVLAAGQGTRFRSSKAKVLHRACGWSLLRWVLEALRPLGLDRVVVVVGHQAGEVEAEALAARVSGLVTVVQAEQRGTGHAVRQVFDAGALDGVERVLVVPGDAPLVTPEVLCGLLDGHAGAVTVLTACLEDPTGYGRVLRGVGGGVEGIVEQRDATDAQRRIREVNASVYVFDRERLGAELKRLKTDNDQGEEYLTDVVAPMVPEGVGAVTADAVTVQGVNDRAELARAAGVLRARMLHGLMRSGVEIADPSTTYVGADVRVAADAMLLPGTHLEGRTTIAAGAAIGPNCRLVDTTVAEDAVVTYTVAHGAAIGPRACVGPFTYLRPGATLAAAAKVGAFVEVKNSVVGEGSKVPHLSYVGDATIGRDSNIGAATVTVNYDGFAKHRTVIGDGVRIGSDTMLVAPVHVGDGAFTGAGSVITKDVPAGALAVERGEQRIVHGYAERKRARAADREREASGCGPESGGG